jgi:hypothetical protein
VQFAFASSLDLSSLKDTQMLQIFNIKNYFKVRQYLPLWFGIPV